MSRRPLDKISSLRETFTALRTNSHPKQPRQYAAVILSLPVEQQASALLEIPEDIRRLVSFYVADHKNKIAGMVSRVAAQPDRDSRVDLINRLPECIRAEVKQGVIDLFNQRKRKP